MTNSVRDYNLSSMAEVHPKQLSSFRREKKILTKKYMKWIVIKKKVHKNKTKMTFCLEIIKMNQVMNTTKKDQMEVQ